MQTVKTRPPQKTILHGNQPYLSKWDKYQTDRPGRTPILMPIIIGMNGRCEITRELMGPRKVASLAKRLRKDLPHYMFDRKLTKYNPVAIFEDYVFYFENHFKNKRPKENAMDKRVKKSPLDLMVDRPVWMLYYFDQKGLKFSKDIQFSTVNDPDDMTRNFVKIATMESNNALLLANRCRCGPKGLKFNLCATISQKVDGRTMKTPIIIDPTQTNEGGNGGFGGWGSGEEDGPPGGSSGGSGSSSGPSGGSGGGN